MGKAPKLVGISFLAIIILSGSLLSGCTKRADADQMTQLEEACAAADRAEQTVRDREAELQRLQGELTQKQQTLQEVNREKATAESRLNGLRSELQQVQAEMARIQRERGTTMPPPNK